MIAVFFVILVAFLSCCPANDMQHWGLFIATVALATVGYIQLRALEKQANADFLLKFNREFFGSKTNQKIIISLEEGKTILNIHGGSFSEYQLDDFLGYYELMARFMKDGLLDFDIIDDMFGHYISLSWRNGEMQEYINALRNETRDFRYYRPFQELAEKIILKEQMIRGQ